MTKDMRYYVENAVIGILSMWMFVVLLIGFVILLFVDITRWIRGKPMSRNIGGPYTASEIKEKPRIFINKKSKG